MSSATLSILSKQLLCSSSKPVFLLSLKQLVETGRGAPDPDDVNIDNWN